jgi:uncharacterized protein (UPF0248 family)
MIPIQELLNRIHWDPEFAKGTFEIGYYDRVDKRIIRVPMRSLYFDPEDHFCFQLMDADGNLHTVPLHRIKQVFRNGDLIWHREH